MAGPWLTADEQRAWRAYMRATTALTARLNRQLQAESGLSLPEYEVLVQLSEAPGGKLRPFQLGLALDWEQSRLSHLLSRMTRRGFVTRRDCPGDRRGALVALTRRGRVAIESAAPGHVAAVRHLVFDQIDSSQAGAFGQAFEAILAALADDGGPLSRPVRARRRAHRGGRPPRSCRPRQPPPPGRPRPWPPRACSKTGRRPRVAPVSRLLIWPIAARLRRRVALG